MALVEAALVFATPCAVSSVWFYVAVDHRSHSAVVEVVVVVVVVVVRRLAEVEVGDLSVMMVVSGCESSLSIVIGGGVVLSGSVVVSAAVVVAVVAVFAVVVVVVAVVAAVVGHSYHCRGTHLVCLVVSNPRQ